MGGLFQGWGGGQGVDGQEELPCSRGRNCGGKQLPVRSNRTPLIWFLLVVLIASLSSAAIFTKEYKVVLLFPINI